MRILFIPFVAVLLFGIFSSSAYALTATMKGNNESAFGIQGSVDDSTHAALNAGTPFTAAENTSISAQDKNAVFVAGTNALDAYIQINFTIPEHSAIRSINFTAWLNASANDELHLTVYNYTGSAFFMCNSTGTTTTNTELQCKFTSGTDIIRILGGGNNRTIAMMPTLFGNSGGNGWFDFAKVDITYSPPPPDPPPQWSANATNMQSPMLYETANNHGFQTDWTDNVAVFNATFQLGRPSGTLTNYTNSSGSSPAVRLTGSTYHINFTQDQFGPVGTYNYTWYANDTSNNWNSSDTVNHVVNKAATSMRLWLNGTEGTKTYFQTQVANFTAQLNISKTITLRSNYTGFVDQTGAQAIYNYTVLGTLGNFSNLTAFWSGDENYTASQKDYLFNVSSTNLTGCADLTLPHAAYRLMKNVSSGATCFRILAQNITLDGQGYQINYSQSAPGYAVDNTGGYDNITIRNLTIVHGSSAVNHAIYGAGMENSTIADNRITLSGNSVHGIFLSSSSDSNTISNNNITTSGTTSYGINLQSSVSNNITGGSVIAKQSLDYYLNNASASNNFTDTNFTEKRRIWFQDVTSWFNYNNQTSGNIWLKTNVSAQSSLNRTLLNWNSTLMKWNDTNSTKGITANYNITGLQAGAQYGVYNTSWGTQTNPYTITTDADGSLNFTVRLGENTEITVNLTVVQQINMTAADVLSLSELPNREGNMLRASPETVSMADASGKLRNIFGPTGEPINFGDILSRMANLFRTQPETTNIYDIGGKARGVYQAQSQLISLNDIADRIRSLFSLRGETITVLDSEGKIRGVQLSSSELLSLGDIGGRILNIFRTNAETITVLDSGGKIRNVYLSQNELVSVGDILNRMANLFRAQAETVSMLDAASKGQGGIFLLTVPETISIYDSSNDMQNLYLIQSELININDISNRIRSLFRAQPDTVGAYDSVLGLRSVYNIQSEMISLSDIAGRLLNIFRMQPDTVSLYDSGGKMRSVYQAQNEPVGIGDIASRILNIFRADSETLSIVDSGIKIRYTYNNQSELISVYFASSSIKNLFRANGDTLTITDSGGRIRYIIRVSQDQVSVFDDEMRLRGIYLVQNELISFSDIAIRILSLFRAQGETINIQDAASKSGGIQNILRSILENIGFSESPAINQILFRSSSELLSLNDIVERIRSLFRVQPDTINILDSGGKMRSVYQAQNELLGIGDIGGRMANLFRANGDAISATDISGRLLNLFRARPETIDIGDSAGRLRSVYQAQNELIGIYDISSISKNFFRIGSDLINLNDVSGRILGLFRTSPETIDIYDSGGRERSVFFSQSELVNLYDSYGKARNVYLSQSELISFNDFASRILNLFRLAFENINIYESTGKARSVNITSFTAQSSLYQNQYQTFDLTLNNTGEENVSVGYNITVYNSAGSAVSAVSCPAATCPYNLAVGQTLISTASWFTGSNAVGSYVAQANVSYGGASVSRNVSFSIIATPTQEQPAQSGGGSRGSSAVTAPVVQQILPLEKIGVEFSGFTVLREITAGEAFAAGVRVKNSFGEPRRISVSINGLPSTWVTITPEEQTIKANSEAVANILIATPVNIVPADYRVEMEVSVGGQTASKTFFILRVKNAPDILNVRPVVNREIRIDKATNQTEVSIFVKNGKNPVQLTRVTERIPKSLAYSVSDVSFELEPSKVLEKDPVVQWDIVFNPGEEDTKIIKYRVKKILDDYSQYVYWNLEQMSVYPYLAGALPFSFKSSANTLAKNQFNPVTIELANDGNVSFDATLSFETPEGWVIIPKEVSRTVKPGESGRFPFEIKPKIAPDGPYTLTLKAVLDRKTYTQQIDFYVTSFKPEQLILPTILALTAVLAAYAIVRAKNRRSRPRFSHMLDVIRDR